MDINSDYYKQRILPQWDKEQDLLINIQQIIEKMVKAESIYVKALMEIRRLRLSDTQFVQNQGLLSLQVTLINFVTSLATQHTEIITNLKDDVQSDLVENQAIQKTYRSHYTTVVEERKQLENQQLRRYEESLDDYYDAVEDDTEQVSEAYLRCKDEYQTLIEQRTVNQNTFQTIWDNYCRIRYNNLSIAASSVRKLFVYVSSATANVQFDIQAISHKLTDIPATQTYNDYKTQNPLPDSSKSPIYHITIPEAVIDTEEPIDPVHCLSEEPPVPFHEFQDIQVAHSDEPSEEHIIPIQLLNMSLSLLQKLNEEKKEQDKLDPTIIRKVSTLFLCNDTKKVSSIQSKLKQYIEDNRLGSLHIAQAMISMLMFSNVEKLSPTNQQACFSVATSICASGSRIPRDVSRIIEDSFRIRLIVCNKTYSNN